MNTRRYDVHVDISLQFARELLKAEGGQKSIVIPAIILHDVGWKKIPEAFHLKAFGPKATAPETNRTHEEEGVKTAYCIAKDELEKREKEAER